MPITVMISLVVTVALFLISLLFRIAARLNLTLPLLYFLAVSTILNPWTATHEKLAFAILYLLTAFSVLSWIFALRRKWQEHQYYKAMKDDMSFQISRARQRGIPLDSVHFDSQGNMRYNNGNNIVESLLRTLSGVLFTIPSFPVLPCLTSSLLRPVQAY